MAPFSQVCGLLSVVVLNENQADSSFVGIFLCGFEEEPKGQPPLCLLLKYSFYSTDQFYSPYLRNVPFTQRPILHQQLRCVLKHLIKHHIHAQDSHPAV